MLWCRFRPESVSLDEKAGVGGTLFVHGCLSRKRAADDLCKAMAVMEPQDMRLGSMGSDREFSAFIQRFAFPPDFFEESHN